MQFSVIVALVIVLELAAGIYGFVRRNELVPPPPPTHTQITQLHADLNPLHCQQVVESAAVRMQFLSAIDRYLPESNPNYQPSVNVAVDFVQDSVSGWIVL